MQDFPYIEASPATIARRKKFYGVATNDAPYITQPTIDGKVLRCPYHKTWHNMLQRIFDDLRPDYAGLTLHEDWLSFMNFRDWAEYKMLPGTVLDKDILVPGNREYGPESCAFVLQDTNMLFTRAKERELPRGVDKNMGRYRATYGTRLLGRFDTAEQAHAAWRGAKAQAIIEASFKEKDPRIPPALLRAAAELLQC